MSAANKTVGGAYLGGLAAIGLVTGTLPAMVGTAALAYGGYMWISLTMRDRVEKHHKVVIDHMHDSAKLIRDNADQLKREFKQAKALFGKNPSYEQQQLLNELQAEMHKVENDPAYAEQLEEEVERFVESPEYQRTLNSPGLVAVGVAASLFVTPIIGLLALVAYQQAEAKA